MKPVQTSDGKGDSTLVIGLQRELHVRPIASRVAAGEDVEPAPPVGRQHLVHAAQFACVQPERDGGRLVQDHVMLLPTPVVKVFHAEGSPESAFRNITPAVARS